MGRRNYRPLAQTQRDRPGQKFRLVRRVGAIVASNAREDTETKGWVKVYRAENLSRSQAEAVLEQCQREPTLRGCFEYAIIPNEQKIP